MRLVGLSHVQTRSVTHQYSSARTANEGSDNVYHLSIYIWGVCLSHALFFHVHASSGAVKLSTKIFHGMMIR